MERITVWMARVGFLSIAACTFGLSFNAISDVARESGAVAPELAWIVPLAVDGMIVTATAVLWTESLSGRGWHMFPLVSIIGPAALSMWANIAHASGQSLLAQVLAAVPPAGLILSLELVAWQIRRESMPDHRGTYRPAAAGVGVAPPAGGVMERPIVDTNGRDARPETHAPDAHARDARPATPQPSSQSAPPPAPGQEVHSPLTAPTRAAARKVVDGVARSAVTSAPARDDTVHVDRDDDTGRITLDIPSESRGAEVWSRIIAAVQESGAVPSQRELASELQVPRSSVRRAIERNRREWDELRQRIEDQPEAASVGADNK
jgi:hypothetical protein